MRVHLAPWPLKVKLAAVTASVVAGLTAALLVALPRAMDLQAQGWLEVLAIAVASLLAGLVAAALLAQLLARPLLDRLSEQGARLRAVDAELASRHDERTQELARTHQALAELERTQQQLVMADRRVSIGRLAAGVAHEINNPLTFVSGNLDFMAEQLPEVARSLEEGDARSAQPALARFAEAVAETRQGAQRVAAIVRGLRTFARDDLDERQPLRIGGPLEAAIEMAMHEIKHRARLIRRFESVPRVLGNEVRLSQVFLNLLVNAAHSIAEGASDRNEIRVSVHAAGADRVAVEVSDTGCGIPEVEQGRIFDPFFTTKPVGVGTGLGLSISRNIVEKLGGAISFESAAGKGTTFRVLLPVARAEDLKPAAEAAARPAALPRGLRLLVVDDEPMVVGSVVRTMQGEIQVVVATGGREALERIAGGERFDRILCDVMMPDLSGPDLLAEVERTAPRLAGAFIFMTGGAFTQGARAFLARHRGPFLEKPLDFDELRRFLHAGPGEARAS